MNTRFADRAAAGRALAERLRALRLARPWSCWRCRAAACRSAAEVARALKAPLDLLLVRKIGAPWQHELALAAVVEGDPPDIVVDEDGAARQRPWTGDYIDAQAQLQLREIARQRQAYLSGRPAVRGARAAR